MKSEYITLHRTTGEIKVTKDGNGSSTKHTTYYTHELLIPRNRITSAEGFRDTDGCTVGMDDGRTYFVNESLNEVLRAMGVKIPKKDITVREAHDICAAMEDDCRACDFFTDHCLFMTCPEDWPVDEIEGRTFEEEEENVEEI